MSIRTLLPRYPTDRVWFAEKFLIEPDTAKPFEFTDHERDLLRDPPVVDLPTYLREAFTYRRIALGAIYVITELVLFRRRELFSGYCDRINREFEMIRRIVESSPLLLAEATITDEKIIIAGCAIIDHNRIYAEIEG